MTATEVTHGANGWHPHLHVLVLASGDLSGRKSGFPRLRAKITCVPLARGPERQLCRISGQSAAAAGDYVGKFGLAEELTLQGKKAGRRGGRTPWEILADACGGDGRSAKLWAEYARAFRGRRQWCGAGALRLASALAKCPMRTCQRNRLQAALILSSRPALSGSGSPRERGGKPGGGAARCWTRPRLVLIWTRPSSVRPMPRDGEAIRRQAR